MMLLQAAQQAASAVQFDPSSYSFDSVAINGVCVWLIQMLKKSDWKLFAGINEGAPVRLVSLIVAALAAAGMTVDWTSVNGVGTLALSGISISSGLALVKNMLFQHIGYKMTYGKEKDAKDLQTQIAELKALVAANAQAQAPTQA